MLCTYSTMNGVLLAYYRHPKDTSMDVIITVYIIVQYVLSQLSCMNYLQMNCNLFFYT